MQGVKSELEHYRARFERFAAQRAGEPAWLKGLRKDAIALLSERGFPTGRDEEWKYASTGYLSRTPFVPAEPSAISGRELAAEGIDVWDGPQLVFVNGFFAPDLSQVGGLPAGVTVLPLSQAWASPRWAAILECELSRGIVEPHGFTALGAAFMTDGAFVHVSDRTVAPRPIHIVHVMVSAGEQAFSAVRNIVVAGVSSQATIVESYLSLGPGKPGTLTCALTGLTLADDAVVSHHRVQREGEAVRHVSSEQARLARGASLRSGTCTLSASPLVRNDVAAVLEGEGADCRLAGLYLARGDQQIDNRIVVDHAAPRGTSLQTYRGVVDDRASGTWGGKIVVRTGAAGTDARQTSRSLQLSRGATVHSRPQLEINNDDVKCSHGASVGQLDQSALFYLRSRGLGPAEARALLTYAFAAELVEPIEVPAVRAAVSQTLLESLSGASSEGHA